MNILPPRTISKSSKKTLGRGFSGKSGRVAYASAKPNAGNDYAVNYVSIRIPKSYCDKIIADSRGTLKLARHPKSQEQDGHVWMNVNLDKLGSQSTFFVYTNPEDPSSALQAAIGLKEFMRKVESNVIITMFCDIGASCTSGVKRKRRGLKYA
ncbi:hypothetical protein N3K66_002939 [Trichothecium roseum]|uniref:Uncharacterized protein n=1 Tax=Trichothecium roseum TaxID=47278 RepID=A0ACC0V4P5_9HYPO|nr:hypothetical protein N3K66_002939 [Trichothecium roseum]